MGVDAGSDGSTAQGDLGEGFLGAANSRDAVFSLTGEIDTLCLQRPCPPTYRFAMTSTAI